MTEGNFLKNMSSSEIILIWYVQNAWAELCQWAKRLEHVGNVSQQFCLVGAPWVVCCLQQTLCFTYCIGSKINWILNNFDISVLHVYIELDFYLRMMCKYDIQVYIGHTLYMWHCVSAACMRVMVSCWCCLFGYS